MNIPLVDLGCLAWFLLWWLGYALRTASPHWGGRALGSQVNAHRLRWMKRVVERDNRVADTSLVSNLIRSVSFLASTSVLALGGLLAAAGSGDHSFGALSAIPLAESSSQQLIEMKILMLAGIFVYSFFKFTWALRQFNYFSIVFGEAPEPHHGPVEKLIWIKRASRLCDLAGRSFNEGLRGYYFAVPVLLWFVSPWAMAFGVVVVVAILYRREFHSKTLRSLRRRRVG